MTKEKITFAELQRAMQVEKKKGGGVKYSFRNAEEIYNHFKSLKTDWELSVSDELVVVAERVFIKAIAKATAGEETRRSEAYAELDQPPVFKGGVKQMSNPQWTGAVSSYARKYALQALFAIGEKDVDEVVSEQGEVQSAHPVKYIDDKMLFIIGEKIQKIADFKQVSKVAISDNVLKYFKISNFEDVPFNNFRNVLEYIEKLEERAGMYQGQNTEKLEF